MPRLIILRGPMGSGKSTIARYLRQVLQDSAELDLDLNADREVSHLEEKLGKENVIAEMYDGGSHTSDPGWIAGFKDRNYDILSVILDSKLETCITRVANRQENRHTEDDVRYHYQKFHRELKPIFSKKARVQEILVSTEGKSKGEVSQDILDHIDIHGLP